MPIKVGLSKNTFSVATVFIIINDKRIVIISSIFRLVKILFEQNLHFWVVYLHVFTDPDSGTSTTFVALGPLEIMGPYRPYIDDKKRSLHLFLQILQR